MVFNLFGNSIHIFVLLIAFLAMANSQGLSGGLEDRDVDSDEIKELANKSVDKISAESNGIYRLVLVKVLRAKSQVVAGTLYRLEIMVGQSKCTKTNASSASVNEENCAYEGSNEDARKIYKVKIWQKPWENFEEITYEEVSESNE